MLFMFRAFPFVSFLIIIRYVTCVINLWKKACPTKSRGFSTKWHCCKKYAKIFSVFFCKLVACACPPPFCRGEPQSASRAASFWAISWQARVPACGSTWNSNPPWELSSCRISPPTSANQPETKMLSDGNQGPTILLWNSDGCGLVSIFKRASQRLPQRHQDLSLRAPLWSSPALERPKQIKDLVLQGAQGTFTVRWPTCS